MLQNTIVPTWPITFGINIIWILGAVREIHIPWMGSNDTWVSGLFFYYIDLCQIHLADISSYKREARYMFKRINEIHIK